MSCPLCSGDCNGEDDPSVSSLDFDIGYRALDCEIDDSNNPWWVDIEVDSDRGGKVYLEIELSVLNGNISIDNNNPQYVRLNPYDSGKSANFKISQSTGSNPPDDDTIEIDVNSKKRSGGEYAPFTNLSVDRRLSSNP